MRRCRIRTGGARRAPRRQAWGQEGKWSGSVGRILCAVAGVTVIPLGPRLPGGSSHLPARSSGRSARSTGVPRIACLFDVAPDGVWPAITVASDAVSSYLAISPLPLVTQRAPKGGIFSATLSVTPPLRWSAPAFTGHAAVRCPDFPLNPEGNSDHLRPVPSGEPTRDRPPALREDSASPRPRRARGGAPCRRAPRR